MSSLVFDFFDREGWRALIEKEKALGLREPPQENSDDESGETDE